MCVALPGKVIKIENDIAVVDFNGNRVNARTGFVKVAQGDQVLVHAGCILQKVDDGQADEIRQLFEELEELGAGSQFSG